MTKYIKILVSRLPISFQQEIKRHYYAWKIKQDYFRTNEQEYNILHELITYGDWVVDIGANIGHYSAKLSELVGPKGHVIAIEPVKTTFELLTANVQHFPHQNVTLLNLAVSDANALASMEIPVDSDGVANYYQAQIDKNISNKYDTFCIKLDSLCIFNRIKLVKIDVEGHEMPALKGMENLILRDHPTIIIETGSLVVINYLENVGYEIERLPGSPNLVCKKKACESTGLYSF